MTDTTIATKTLDVPGAHLYVETRGAGPVLLLITGGPMDAGAFSDLATRLADRYTVVTYDQRGHSRSALDGASEGITVPMHADDAAAVLIDAGDGPAYVYGNSGGGTIGLELVVRHADLVSTFVAHEPPLLELLPDAERWRSTFAEIDRTFHEAGVYPAMEAFGMTVEEGGPKYSEEMQAMPSTPESEEMMARVSGNFEFFLGHELQPIISYVPDLEVLRNVPTRIVSAAGENSQEQASRRAAIALAEALGTEVTYLPGAHGGWGSDPQEFADRLDRALRGSGG
jgi:pimeloyl-ACP methyl ester carboxylesterase